MAEKNYLEERYIMDALQAEGLCCSQIIMQMALYKRNSENEEMMDALAAFSGGLKTGHNCGALIGGALVLAMADKRLSKITIPEFIRWFEEIYGHVDCVKIGGENGEKRAEICPEMIQNSYFKALEILEKYGLSL